MHTATTRQNKTVPAAPAPASAGISPDESLAAPQAVMPACLVELDLGAPLFQVPSHDPRFAGRIKANSQDFALRGAEAVGELSSFLAGRGCTGTVFELTDLPQFVVARGPKEELAHLKAHPSIRCSTPL